ncbi:phosphotransferase [Filimonas effusa]|uniref:Aminoglycoside phosphotransferase domain-containing protein n=1 Tax=Filimonas effusa TaxID=2508721 RepID=A0A4Q1D9Q9_9BACT|nr:phosphotransferase [Filimonas effusa]RXK86101.1 hypothetical protein ESB13_04630 [Filimonas effusa]
MDNQMNDIKPSAYLKEAIENVLNKKIIQCVQPNFGLSAALRYSIELEDKSKVFVKAATDDQTAGWLRTEHSVLASYQDNFMPEIINWIDEFVNFPILITQDFSNAFWAASDKGVHWRKGDIELLLDTVKKLSTIKGRHLLPKLENHNTGVWAKIAEDPEGFLKLKMCSGNWLMHSIDYLIEAESKVDKTGETLVHGDIRSDNICIDGSRVVFVDWSNACIGSADHDLVNLLPTLHLEGGPDPFQIMPDAASQAAALCATHIRRLSNDKSMPFWLKDVFKKLIAIELEWAAQCLHLDRPDGIK